MTGGSYYKILSASKAHFFCFVALYLPPYSNNILGGMPLFSRNLQYVPDLEEFSDGRKNKHINKTNTSTKQTHQKGQMSAFGKLVYRLMYAQ